MVKLNAQQEAFAVAVVKNGGDKVAAYKAAGYSLRLNPNAMGVQADKLYNHPKISLRIAELQKKAAKVADKKFSISVEQRLKWLEQVAKAGLEFKGGEQGGYENLSATNKAIEVLNNMLGTDEEGSAVKPVKVFVGVQDASRD